MFHIAGKQQEKTLPRSELGIILGPAPRTYNAVRAYTFHTKTVKNRHHFKVLDQLPQEMEWKIKTEFKKSEDNLIERNFQPVLVKGALERILEIKNTNVLSKNEEIIENNNQEKMKINTLKLQKKMRKLMTK